MATLKTNYKDDLFSGSRKYEMTRNQDGTVSFEDVTDYLQEGDPFGSTDINVTNAEVNALNQNLTELNEVVPSTASSSNKLATMADISNTLNNHFDTDNYVELNTAQGTTYTCPSDGIVQAGSYLSGIIYIQVNGISVIQAPATNNGVSAFAWRVFKDDVIKISYSYAPSGSNIYATFYPSVEQ